MSASNRTRAVRRPAAAVHTTQSAGAPADLPQLPPFLADLPPVTASYAPQQPATQSLQRLIQANSYGHAFQTAIDAVAAQNIPELRRIRTLDQFYFYVDALVCWIPGIRLFEVRGQVLHERTVYNRICQFYFYFNQDSLEGLQSPVEPEDGAHLTPISAWLRRFAQDWGGFLDTPASAASLATFAYAPEYNTQDYEHAPDQYATFNAFFARRFRDIAVQRPVANPDDDRVIVAAADCTYVGQWTITTGTRPGQLPPRVPNIVVKHIEWPIEELLADSRYGTAFAGGVFSHSFLNTYDYHRLHTPVSGRILEARFIPGQVYLEVGLQPDGQDADGQIAHAVVPQRYLDAADGTGYQFVQCRGLLVVESAIGKVAVLPMGMAHVSSVVFIDPDDPDQGGIYAPTVDALNDLLQEKLVGRWLQKGQAFSYFQFGGSDVVTVFERKANVQITCTQNQHYGVRSRVGQAGIAQLAEVCKG